MTEHTLTEAAHFDAELQDLQSFVLVETGHMPTVNAIASLRAQVAKALGHSDPFCVSHCVPGVKHSMCGCRCGQHRKPLSRPGTSVDVPPFEGPITSLDRSGTARGESGG